MKEPKTHSLTDEWVSVDELRKVIDKWEGREITSDAHLLHREVEALLPAPRTMDKIEWDDEKHGLAEAVAEWFKGEPTKVVMLTKVSGKIMVHQDDKHSSGLRHVNPGILTPTGRKCRLEPEDEAPASPIEDKPTPEQQALARDIFGSFPPEERHVHWAKPISESASPRPEDVPVGEPWQVEIEGCTAIGYRADPETRLCWAVVYPHHTGRHWMYDSDVTLIARLVPETTEKNDEQVFDPAYLYRDRDGEEWEYQTRTMRWRCYPETGVSFEVTDSPPAEHGPYTRIVKEEANE